MDEHLRKNKHWVGLGALAIIFLCLALCGMGAMASMFFRGGADYGPAPYVQAPAGEEGVAPPPASYGHGRMHMTPGGPFSFVGGAIGLLFRLAFFGLLLLLMIGLVKRLFWGPRWGARHWAAHHRGMPPKGKPWKGKPHGHWGPPWMWPCDGPPDEADASSEPDDAEGTDQEEFVYNGPQE